MDEKEIYNIAFRNVLKLIRNEIGKTQAKFEEAASLPAKYLGKLERGEKNGMGSYYLYKLYNAGFIDANDFFNRIIEEMEAIKTDLKKDQ